MIECQTNEHEKTIIVIRDNNANILTSIPSTARRLDYLCGEYPSAFTLDKVHRIGAGMNIGKVDWKSYNVAAQHVQIVEPDGEPAALYSAQEAAKAVVERDVDGNGRNTGRRRKGHTGHTEAAYEVDYDAGAYDEHNERHASDDDDGGAEYVEWE